MMKIAMLAPISWRTPPRHYGAWELVASLITEGLVERGIDVTLFATGDSITGAKLEWVCPKGYSEDPAIDAKVWECLHIAHVMERAGDFDLIHNNFDFLPLSYSGLIDTPMLTTIHGFSSPKILPVYQKYNRRTAYASISDADRDPSLDYVATVHHGIQTDLFPLHDRPGKYLLFYGRIHPDKGAAEAIEVARRSGHRLVIAGIIQDQRYFDEQVAPYLGKDGIEYIGSVGPDRRGDVLGNAIALLHLINFNEPFGLSIVEAMACGTPVIARPRGSIPELIQDQKQGAIVQGIDEAIAAIEMVQALDRVAVRERAVKHFSREIMVEKYLRVYEQILAKPRKK